MIENKVYTQEDLDNAVKKAVQDIIQSHLEQDVKEIKQTVNILNDKINVKLARIETAVYYIFPVILALLTLKQVIG